MNGSPILFACKITSVKGLQINAVYLLQATKHEADHSIDKIQTVFFFYFFLSFCLHKSSKMHISCRQFAFGAILVKRFSFMWGIFSLTDSWSLDDGLHNDTFTLSVNQQEPQS